MRRIQAGLLAGLSVLVLANAGPPSFAGESKADLITLLSHPDRFVRGRAAVNLRRLTNYAQDAVPALRMGLQDSDQTVRIECALTLVPLEPGEAAPFDVLRKEVAAESGWRTVSSGLHSAIRDWGGEGRWPALAVQPTSDLIVLALTRDDRRGYDSNAALALMELGHRTPAAIPPLLTAWKSRSGSSSGRYWALRALGEATPGGSEVLAALVQASADADAEVRLGAIEGLAALGDRAKTAAPTLRKALEDADGKVRVHAAGALLDLGVASEAAVGAIASALADANLQRPTLDALTPAHAQAHAATLVPVFVKLLEAQGDERIGVVEIQVLGLLRAIGPAARSAVPLLRRAMGSKNEVRAIMAAETLAALEPSASEPLTFLIAQLGSQDTSAGRRAAATLGRLGRAAAIPSLVQATKHRSARLRADALRALVMIGTANDEVRGAVEAGLKDDAMRVQAAAARALVALEIRPAEGLDRLVDALKSPDAQSRGAAAEELAALGPRARPAQTHLRAALDHPEGWVRSGVEAALRAIEGK